MGKYALLLYGSLRSYKSSYKYLYNNLLSINDVDIFISTHNLPSLSSNLEKDKTSVKFENIYGNNLKIISYIEDIDQTYLITVIKEKIKVIDSNLYELYTDEIEKITNLNDFYSFYGKLINKDNQGFYFKNKQNFKYVLHEIIMLYHRYNAFLELENYSKTNNILYDGVIIYRPDLFHKLPLLLDNFIFKDDVIYFRLEFMMISTYNGIKKLTSNLLKEYYLLNDKENKQNKYLSETQHNIFLYSNFRYSFDMLNILHHYRSIDDNTNIPLSCIGTLGDNSINEFYNYLKTINNKILY